MGTYTASWGAPLKWVSASTTVLLGALAVAPVPGVGWPRILLLAIPAGALPFVVCGYEIREGVLYVRRLWWKTRIDLTGLRTVQFDPAVLKGSLKTCGNGGLFSFTGWYWNRRLGAYRMYVTDLKRSVVLAFDNRRIVVSPDDPESFVRDVSAYAVGG